MIVEEQKRLKKEYVVLMKQAMSIEDQTPFGVLLDKLNVAWFAFNKSLGKVMLEQFTSYADWRASYDGK